MNWPKLIIEYGQTIAWIVIILSVLAVFFLAIRRNLSQSSLFFWREKGRKEKLWFWIQPGISGPKRPHFFCLPPCLRGSAVQTYQTDGTITGLQFRFHQPSPQLLTMNFPGAAVIHSKSFCLLQAVTKKITGSILK